MTFSDLVNESNAILPELIVGFAICVVIAVDMFTPRQRSRAVAGTISLVGVGLAFVVLAQRIASATDAFRAFAFGGMLTYDLLKSAFAGILLIGTGACVAFAMRSRETEPYRQGEFFSLLLGGLFGALFLVASDTLLMFVLGLETLSLCSYALASSLKRDRLSAEAGLKYVVFGVVSNALMLLGMSYIYGMSGTLQIEEGVSALATGVAQGRLPAIAVILAYVLVLGGVGYKIAMVPFHFWSPDVYQGSPTPVTAYLSVVSKAAGLGGLLRLTEPFFALGQPALPTIPNPLCETMLPVLFGIVAAVTMTFGNLIALRQTNVKRMLAYSSIAHAGYLLLGMTVYEAGAVEAMLAYMLIYVFMNLGAFWIVIVLVNHCGGAEIARFKGTAWRAPFLFIAMFIFLISLTGIPPTAGFAAKFILFRVVVGAGLAHMTVAGALTPMATFYFVLALIGVVNSVVSLYYYMNIARVMAFEAPESDAPLGERAADKIYAALLAVPTLALLNFGPILDVIRSLKG